MLAQVLHDGGIADVTVRQEADEIPFRVEDWSTIVMGSGLRRLAMDLGPQAAGVLEDTARWAHRQQITAVRVVANYATAYRRSIECEWCQTRLLDE